MKYRHKPTGDLVEIVSFDELVAIGREQNPGREGMPWSFVWAGRSVSHETDTCYLIDGAFKFQRGQFLGFNPGSGCSYTFIGTPDPATWEPVDDVPPLSYSEATDKFLIEIAGMVALSKTAGQLKDENERLQNACDEFREMLKQRTTERDEFREALHRAEARVHHMTADLVRAQDSNKELFRQKNEATELFRQKNEVTEAYIETHVAAWERIQAALPEPAADDSRSLVERILERLACADYCEGKLKVQAPAPDPQPVWCQVEGNLTTAELDRWHILLSCSSHMKQVAMILCNRNPDGTFTPIARGFLPTYKIPG